MVESQGWTRLLCVAALGGCWLSSGAAWAQPAPGPAPAPPPVAPPPAPAPAPPETTAPSEKPPTPPAEAQPPAEKPAAPAEATEEPPAEATEATEEPPAEAAAPEPETVLAPEPAPTPEYRVPEEQWQAALEQPVTVEVDGAEPLHGKLVASTPAAAVVIGDDGNVHTLQKADVASLAVDAPPEAAPEPPAEEAPAAEDEAKPAEDKAPEKDDWKKFGVFTSHGVSYAHWRTDQYRAGAAAYAGDLGVGYNWSRPWGVYLVLGGHAGARLVDRTIKGNFGHLAGMIRYRGKKRFVGMAGLSLAWSKLEEPTRRVKDVSVSIPLKAMAQFEVSDNLYVAMGVGYEVGFFSQGRIANGLSLQATLAYW